MNDFMAAGGDGYNAAPRQPPGTPFTSNGELMESVVREGIGRPETPIGPAIQGRITCTDTARRERLPGDRRLHPVEHASWGPAPAGPARHPL